MKEIWDSGFEVVFTYEGLDGEIRVMTEEQPTRLDDALLEKLGIAKFLREVNRFNGGSHSLLGTKCPKGLLKPKFGEAKGLRAWQEESVFNLITDPTTGLIKGGWKVSLVLNHPSIGEEQEWETELLGISFQEIKKTYPLARTFELVSFFKDGSGWIDCEIEPKYTSIFLLGLKAQGVEKVKIKLDTGEQPDYHIKDLLEHERN